MHANGKRAAKHERCFRAHMESIVQDVSETLAFHDGEFPAHSVLGRLSRTVLGDHIDAKKLIINSLTTNAYRKLVVDFDDVFLPDAKQLTTTLLYEAFLTYERNGYVTILQHTTGGADENANLNQLRERAWELHQESTEPHMAEGFVVSPGKFVRFEVGNANDSPEIVVSKATMATDVAAFLVVSMLAASFEYEYPTVANFETYWYMPVPMDDNPDRLSPRQIRSKSVFVTLQHHQRKAPEAGKVLARRPVIVVYEPDHAKKKVFYAFAFEQSEPSEEHVTARFEEMIGDLSGNVDNTLFGGYTFENTYPDRQVDALNSGLLDRLARYLSINKLGYAHLRPFVVFAAMFGEKKTLVDVDYVETPGSLGSPTEIHRVERVQSAFRLGSPDEGNSLFGNVLQSVMVVSRMRTLMYDALRKRTDEKEKEEEEEGEELTKSGLVKVRDYFMRVAARIQFGDKTMDRLPKKKDLVYKLTNIDEESEATFSFFLNRSNFEDLRDEFAIIPGVLDLLFNDAIQRNVANLAALLNCGALPVEMGYSHSVKHRKRRVHASGSLPATPVNKLLLGDFNRAKDVHVGSAGWQKEEERPTLPPTYVSDGVHSRQQETKRKIHSVMHSMYLQAVNGMQGTGINVRPSLPFSADTDLRIELLPAPKKTTTTQSNSRMASHNNNDDDEHKDKHRKGPCPGMDFADVDSELLVPTY